METKIHIVDEFNSFEQLMSEKTKRSITHFDSYEYFSAWKGLCRACPIGKVYNCVVQSCGNTANPKVVVIGEAPGKDEIEQGAPFVGKSGKLLRSILKQAGFGANNSLITNTIPCRPENNQFPKDESIVKACKNTWLKEELRLLNPDYLLLVGSQSLKFLLGMEGITKYRGAWFNRKLNGNPIKILATYHPSYVLRVEFSPEKKHVRQQFEQDIMTVGKAAGFMS